MVTASGTEPVESGVECAGGLWVATESVALAWLPPGAQLAFPAPPAVQAALVERVAWRLEPLLPAPTLLRGGKEEPDPARFKGVSVRSVRKTRRDGPPVIIALADRQGEGILAVLDREAEGVLAHERFPLGDSTVVPHVLPAFDANGDGLHETVVWGGEGEHAFRSLFSVDLRAQVALIRGSSASGGGPRCSAVQ
jgi:hypothetical protein